MSEKQDLEIHRLRAERDSLKARLSESESQRAFLVGLADARAQGVLAANREVDMLRKALSSVAPPSTGGMLGQQLPDPMSRLVALEAQSESQHHALRDAQAAIRAQVRGDSAQDVLRILDGDQQP